MMKTIALAAICLALTNCATPSVPSGPAELPAPVALDPRLCAFVPREPALPDAAGLVMPASEPERAAMLAFILWSQSVLAWARALEARADLAVAACETVPGA